MRDFLFNLLFYLSKGEVEMMAMLFAQKVILGKIGYCDVPAKLREQVKEILIDSGLEDLIETC